ncbi:MAG TPA: hypothetical protein PKM16_07170, partial [Bacteroidia bacterium]|nr:hypothetical protein [Bacteroidia bacterium]
SVWKKSIDPKFEKLAGFMGMLDKGSSSVFNPNDLVASIMMADGIPGIVYVAAQTKKESTVNGQTTISYTNQYMAFDLKDGSYKWEKPVVMNDLLGTVINTPSGLLICPMSSGNARINLLDYKTGATLLGKKGRGVVLKGSVLNYTQMKEGMIVNSRVLSGSSSKNYIYLLDPITQEEKFSKPATISGDVSRIIQSGSKLIVLTNEETDVYDLNTGAFILDKAINGGISLSADKDHELFVFNLKDDLLYASNKKDASLRTVSSAPLKFEGKEDARYLEIRDKGILVTSDQNMAMLSFDGKLTFQKYMEAPRLPGLTRALYAAYAIRAAYVGAVSGYASAAFGAASTQIKVEKGDVNAAIGKEVTAGLSTVYGQLSEAGFSYAGKAFKAMNTRFKASAESNSSLLMMTQTDAKKVGLQEMNKDTGEVGTFIDLGKDKEPVYEVDVVENRIYYRKGIRDLVAYGF